MLDSLRNSTENKEEIERARVVLKQRIHYLVQRKAAVRRSLPGSVTVGAQVAAHGSPGAPGAPLPMV
jgi:hypothetical protein